MCYLFHVVIVTFLSMYGEKNILHMKLLHMKLLHMKLSTNERNLYHDNNRLKRPEL